MCKKRQGKEMERAKREGEVRREGGEDGENSHSLWVLRTSQVLCKRREVGQEKARRRY